MGTDNIEKMGNNHEEFNAEAVHTACAHGDNSLQKDADQDNLCISKASRPTQSLLLAP